MAKAKTPVGKFMLASHDGLGTLIVGSRKQDIEDLYIPPHAEVVVDPAWENIPHFVRDVDNGKIKVRRSDMVPTAPDLEISEEFKPEVDESLRQLARVICDIPLNEQLKSAINIGELVNDQGIPRRGTKVTVLYLKEKHLPFLRATLDLEKRWQKRPEVISELENAISRINSL